MTQHIHQRQHAAACSKLALLYLRGQKTPTGSWDIPYKAWPHTFVLQGGP